jgi:hypothetical protein
MTVPTTRASTNPVATGSAREWSFGFRIDAKEDVKLIIVDALGNDSDPIDQSLWDIAGLGEDQGFITYPLSPLPVLASGSTVRIDRRPVMQQNVNLKSQGPYSPETVEAALDRLTMMVQGLEEDKNILYARVLTLIDAVGNITGVDLGGLADLQAFVDAAGTSATLAAASEASAADSAAGAESSAEAASAAAVDAGDLRDLVDAMVHGADEYAPGKKSAVGVLTDVQTLLTTAPSTNGRTIGDHAGEEGTDNVEQEFLSEVADLGAVVRFVRGALRPARFKLLPDLLQLSASPGFDERWAFVRVINDMGGVSALTLEGPADPDDAEDVLLKPSIIAQGVQALSDNEATSAARNVTVQLDVPAGSNRAFKASCYFIAQGVPSGTVALTCASATNITVRGSDGGTSGPSGSDPILSRVWTGDIAGTAGLTAVPFVFAVPTNMTAVVAIVQVINNVSGHEDYVCTARDDALTSEAATVNPSAPAGSLVVVDAAHQGADALTGMTISGLDTVATGKTPLNRAPKDLSYALGYKSDVATGSVAYTASSAKAGPGSVTAVVFLPVTESIGGGGEDNLITASVKTLAPGEQADVLVHNGGLRYFLSSAEPKA